MNVSRGLTSSPARVATEADLDAVPQALEPAVALEPLAPVAGQRADRVDGHDPHPLAPLGERRGEVELADVAAEEVLEIDRRDQQVDPLRRPPRGRRARAARSCRRSPGPGSASVAPALGGPGSRSDGGSASSRSRLRGSRRTRERTAAAASRSRANEHPLGAERLAPGPTARRAPRSHSPASSTGRGRCASNAPKHSALARGHSVAAAQLETVGDLTQPQTSTK